MKSDKIIDYFVGEVVPKKKNMTFLLVYLNVAILNILCIF